MDARLNGFRYSVAMRTLGLAGDKYQQELISIKNQTGEANPPVESREGQS